MKLVILIICLVFIKIIRGSDDYDFGVVNLGAKCLNYIGDPIDQPLCENIFSKNIEKIYSSDDDTQNSQISSQQTIVKSFQALTFLQSQCNDLLFAQFGICSIYLSPCIQTTPMITPLKNISLPQRLCKSVCERMVSNCSRLSEKIDCSISFIFPKIGTFYNLSDYGYNDNDGLYEVPCFDPTTIYNNISSNRNFIEICPTPLLLKNSSDSKYYSKRGYTYISPTNCVLPCPVPNYPKEKWDQILTMSKILSSISFACSVYNLISFGILKKGKSKYTICIASFSGSIALVNLGDIIKIGVGYDSVLCPEPGRSATQTEDPICGLTAALFHIGICNCVLWSTTMCIYLYGAIKQIKTFRLRWFIIFNTSFSLISLLIAAASSKFEAGTGSIECWIRDRWYVICLFWIPCSIALLIGTICIIAVIIEIYKISKNVKLSESEAILRQIKPLISVILISGSFTYLLIIFFDIERNFGGYRSAVSDYVLCLLNSSDGGEECHTKGPSFNPYFMFYFFMRFFGILFFLIYGTSKNARDCWKELFIKIKNTISDTSSTLNSNSGGSGINQKQQQQQQQQQQQNEIKLEKL
ncbi:hypothetical protein RB653_008452 [Dictyostelium firmibasis]|uniref:G-protein coupled receptors family 2 profile 2 domain-containing protein n=1 Tax=Dictyostelium firmibasis TaxID=79012 RepID=A0AAN7YPC4_9MYCE